MEKKNQPAYPTEVSLEKEADSSFHQNGNTTALFHGLTKREYFAAIAMQGFCANPDWAKNLTENDWNDYIKRIAGGSLDVADALLTELDKTKTNQP